MGLRRFRAQGCSKWRLSTPSRYEPPGQQIYEGRTYKVSNEMKYSKDNHQERKTLDWSSSFTARRRTFPSSRNIWHTSFTIQLSALYPSRCELTLAAPSPGFVKLRKRALLNVVAPLRGERLSALHWRNTIKHAWDYTTYTTCWIDKQNTSIYSILSGDGTEKSQTQLSFQNRLWLLQWHVFLKVHWQKIPERGKIVRPPVYLTFISPWKSSGIIVLMCKITPGYYHLQSPKLCKCRYLEIMLA